MTLEQELQSTEYTNKSPQEILEIVKNKSESVVGANLPFTGTLNKTTYSLSGKQLETVRGQLLDISTRHIILSTNLLSLGDIIYPTVPRRRVKLLPDSDIRLYALSNVSRLFTLRR